MNIYEIADDMKSTQAEIDDGATYPDGGPYDLAHLANRIIDAHEREIGVMRRELAAKDTEIARLTAALKPVLDCVEEGSGGEE